MVTAYSSRRGAARERGAVVKTRCLVIVPAMNERDSIGPLVKRIRQHCSDADVLVVDDGSTDGTIAHVPAGVFVVSLPFNLGIGGAMQTGYRFAHLHGYDMAVQLDGDGQHRPFDIPKLMEVLQQEEADMVIGSRFTGENAAYRQSLSRWVGGRFLDKLIYLLSGLKLTDCTSGFRIVNKRVIAAFSHWYPEDYPEPEVALLLARTGFVVKETPVRMRQRMTGVSSISVSRGVYYLMKVGFCLLLDTCRNPWPACKTDPAADASASPDSEHKPSGSTPSALTSFATEN